MTVFLPSSRGMTVATPLFRQFLFEDPFALVLHWIKVLPLRLDLVIGLQLLVGFREAEALGHGGAGHVDHHQQVDPQAAVGLLDAGQVEVEDVVVFEGAQQVPPAEREEAAVGPAEGVGEAGHGDHEADHLVLVVDHGLDQVLVDEGEVLLDVIMDLALGQRHRAVDLVEGLVEQVEELHGPVQDILFLLELEQAQVAALADAVGQAHQLLGEGRHVGGHLGAELDVVDLLGEAQRLEQPGIIGVVVVAGDGRQLVEALDQHPLGVEVAEAVRAGHGLQAQLPRPVLGGGEQGGGDLGVVDAVEPAEAQVLRLVLLVGGVVVDGGDAARQFAFLISHEQLAVGVLESRVLLPVKYLQLVADQLRHPEGMLLVKGNGKHDEMFQVGLRLDFLDFDSHGHLAGRL